MALEMKDDTIISDEEVCRRMRSGELVKAPSFGEPPTNPRVMRELRDRVAAWRPRKRNQVDQ